MACGLFPLQLLQLQWQHFRCDNEKVEDEATNWDGFIEGGMIDILQSIH